MVVFVMECQAMCVYGNMGLYTRIYSWKPFILLAFKCNFFLLEWRFTEIKINIESFQIFFEFLFLKEMDVKETIDVH